MGNVIKCSGNSLKKHKPGYLECLEINNDVYRCPLETIRSPSAWVRILVSVRGEIRHPLWIMVPKWMGFKLDKNEAITFKLINDWEDILNTRKDWKSVVMLMPYEQGN